MTTTELPHRQTLRTLYDEAIAELNPTRNYSLTKDFSAKIGDAVFEAGYSALNDAVTDTHRMLTVSAPCGSGKTSFSYALAAAVTRLAERDPTETPQATYNNLEIAIIPQHTKTILSKFFKSLPNRRAYTQWMKEAILQHTKVGDKVLLVCRLALFANCNVPWWPTDDERFNNSENYTKSFQWDFEGRNLSAIHYGIGIGSNDWKDANVVFLFDDFVLPKAAAICTTQGLTSQQAHQGDLGAMTTLSSKRAGVASISDGHVLRQIRQLASRGNVRNYDEHGVCGKMRLVIACDKKRFLSNVQMLFPGVRKSNIRVVSGVDDNNSIQAKVLELLSTAQGDILHSKEISRHIGRDWRSIVHYVNTPAFESACAALGWKYKNRKGCKGSYFKRVTFDQSEGALSAHLPSPIAPMEHEGILSMHM
jgi:hypothetical protein